MKECGGVAATEAVRANNGLSITGGGMEKGFNHSHVADCDHNVRQGKRL